MVFLDIYPKTLSDGNVSLPDEALAVRYMR